MKHERIGAIRIEAARKVGRLDDYIRVAVRVDDTHVYVRESDYRIISGREPPNATSIAMASDATRPVPQDQWPLYARWLRSLAAPEDRGIGDTIARALKPLGGQAFKRAYKLLTGRDCGCDDRQARLNAMYPLRVGE